MGQQIAQAFYQTHSIALWIFVRIRGDSLNLATTTYLGLKPQLHIKVAQYTKMSKSTAFFAEISAPKNRAYVY